MSTVRSYLLMREGKYILISFKGSIAKYSRKPLSCRELDEKVDTTHMCAHRAV